MDTISSFKSDRPTVLLFSEPSYFVLTIIEKLLAEYCRVIVFSENQQEWRSICEHLKDNSNLVFTSVDMNMFLENSYVIFISSLFSKYGLEINKPAVEVSRLELIRNFSNKVRKIIYVLPIVIKSKITNNFYNSYERKLKLLRANETVIYLDSLIGKRIDLFTFHPFNKAITDCVNRENISFPIYMKYSPLPIENAINLIIKSLFTFSEEKKYIYAKGDDVFADELIDILRRYSSTMVISRSERDVEYCSIKDNSKITYKTKHRLYEEIDESIKWARCINNDISTPPNISKTKEISNRKTNFSLNKTLKNIKALFRISGFRWNNSKKKDHPLITKSYVSYKKILFIPFIKGALISIFLFFLIVLPYLVTFLSIAPALYAKKKIASGDIETSRKCFVISYAISSSSLGIYTAYQNIKPLKSFYELGYTLSKTTQKLNDIFLNLIDISRAAAKMNERILGESEYNLDLFVNTFKVNLDSIYQKLSLVESDIKNINQSTQFSVKEVISYEDIRNLRKKVLAFGGIAENLGEILGRENEKKYLILFKNNLNLKPAGGSISAFAVININKGFVTELNVYSVSEADSKLTGYVKPPDILEKYLKKESWTFADSNWDPDFLESAQRAEWFLEKELGIQSDGVVSFDIDALADILKAEGPVYIDEGNEINDQNLKEVIQYQSQRTKPESTELQNYAKTLLEKTFEKILTYDKDRQVVLADAIYKNLEMKHIQVYLNSIKSQEKISGLGWDGGIGKTVCELPNCYIDLVSVNEANFGSNNANYFISRYGYLRTYVSKDFIKRELEYTLKNNANPAIGKNGAYTTYLRVIASKDSFFEKLKLSGTGSVKNIDPDTNAINDKVEAGILVDLPPQQSKTISFVWQSDNNSLSFDENGQYMLEVIRQAGVDPYRLVIEVNLPGNIKYGVDPNYLLTNKQIFRYNNPLTKDLFVKFFW